MFVVFRATTCMFHDHALEAVKDQYFPDLPGVLIIIFIYISDMFINDMFMHLKVQSSCVCPVKSVGNPGT